MTKKTFLFACLLGLFVPSTRAYNHRNPVNCAVSVEEGETLPLQVKKDEKEMIGKPDKKGIIFIPEVFLQDNVLRFITPCNGCTFRLVQNNNICYEIEIMGNTLSIPTTFTGIYELQIVSGEYLFYTEIEL